MVDGRAGFAAGGFIAGAAAVAVACAVTLSNASALADVPGEAVDADVVRVAPSAASPSVTPSPTATLAPAAPSPVPTAEVVPAPEPYDVAAPQEAAPAAPPAPAATPDATEDEIAAEALRSGSWDRLRTWAEAHGWSSERVDQWIALLQQNLSQLDGRYESDGEQAPVETGDESGHDFSSWSGWKRDQSPQPPRGD